MTVGTPLVLHRGFYTAFSCCQLFNDIPVSQVCADRRGSGRVFEAPGRRQSMEHCFSNS